MKTIDPGHRYELACLDGEGVVETLQFVKRTGPHYPGNEAPARPGTILQEVLRACVARLDYVSRQIPCAETEAAKRLIEAAIVLLEVRAKRVKGKHLDAYTMTQIVYGGICPRCGHVQCDEEEHI